MSRSTWGSKRYRYDDLWELRYTDALGQRPSEYIHGNESDADRRLAELRILHEGVDPSGLMTLTEFWEFVYLPMAKMVLAPKTLEGYCQKFYHDIQPEFGNVPLKDIRPRAIQKWLNELPPSTARHAKAVLSAILSRAFTEELIDDNPALRRFVLPKGKSGRERSKDKLTYDELCEIAMDCMGEPWEAAFLGSGMGGASRYESCGVQEPDVRERNEYAIVTLRRGVHRVSGEVIVRDALKNEFREREMVIEPPFSKRYLALAKQAKLEAYENGWENAWLVGDGFGGPMCPNNMSQAYKRWFLNKPHHYIPFSNLRNSYSTYMLERGIDGSMVAKMLGNNERSTTEKHYERPDGASFIAAIENLQK